MDTNNTYVCGHRYRIYPTEEQKVLINKFIHLYRYIYNWGINKEKEHYQDKLAGESNKGFYTFYDLCKLFKEHRDAQGNEWLKEIPNTTARLALRDVVNSYTQFFNKKNRHPKFKSRKTAPKMFKTRNDRFYIDGNKVRFEGLARISRGPGSIVDTVDLHFDTGYKRLDDVKYIQPSISIDNLGNYWVSFNIEKPIVELDAPKTEPIGIDLGVRKTITLSTGESFTRPNDKIKRLEKRLAHAQRHYTRDVNRRLKEAKHTKTKYEDIPVSKRSEKRAQKVRKLYAKITHIKENFYHNTIKQIILRNPKSIVIETLDSMRILKQAKGRQLRNLLFHADFYTLHKIIEDKCDKYGINLIKADIKYPSTQICSNCGNRYHVGKSEVYHCPNCGFEIDRDINAAINLRKLAY